MWLDSCVFVVSIYIIHNFVEYIYFRYIENTNAHQRPTWKREHEDKSNIIYDVAMMIIPLLREIFQIWFYIQKTDQWTNISIEFDETLYSILKKRRDTHRKKKLYFETIRIWMWTMKFTFYWDLVGDISLLLRKFILPLIMFC